MTSVFERIWCLYGDKVILKPACQHWLVLPFIERNHFKRFSYLIVFTKYQHKIIFVAKSDLKIFFKISQISDSILP